MVLVIKISAGFYHCDASATEEIGASNITIDDAESGVSIGFEAGFACATGALSGTAG